MLPRIGTAEDPVRIGVLISGGGSGLAALLKHQLQKDCSHKTALVVSNRDDAGGLNHASDYIVFSYVLNIV